MAYDKLAQKGRYGDTEIRNVAGRKSHVNRKESNLIDLYGMLGERLVRDAGAGTINPKTGLPEYHKNMSWYGETIGDYHNNRHAGGYSHKTEDATKAAYADAPDEFNKAAYMAALTSEDPEAGKQYLLDVGIPENKIEYFESNIDVKGELDLAQEARTLSGEAATLTEAGATLAETQAEAQYGTEGEAYTSAQAAFDIGEKGVKEQFRAGKEAYRIGGLTIAEGERGAQARFGLGMEQAGLQAGKSLSGIYAQTSAQQEKGGFGPGGAVAAAGRKAKRGVFQDYTMQQKQLAEAQTSAMTGFGLQREGLASDWAGTQTQYGTEGIAMQGLTETMRGQKASADIAYTGVMGTGTAAVGVEGEEGYVPASEDFTAGSADITRAGAGIDRRQADLTYKQKKFSVGQRAADEWWETYEATNV